MQSSTSAADTPTSTGCFSHDDVSHSVEYAGTCYTFSSANSGFLDFHDANCFALGLQPVKVTSEDVHNVLVRQLQYLDGEQGSKAHWIALAFRNGNWVYDDEGQEVLDDENSQWGTGVDADNPTQTTSRPCVAMVPPSYDWGIKDCVDRARYICQKRIELPSCFNGTDQDHPVNTSVAYRDVCYTFSLRTSKFLDFHDFNCISLGYEAVRVMSPITHHVLATHLHYLGNSQPYWIGIANVNDNWVYDDAGTLLLEDENSQWASGVDETNYTQIRRCVAMVPPTYDWDIEGCLDKFNYICQKEIPLTPCYVGDPDVVSALYNGKCYLIPPFRDGFNDYLNTRCANYSAEAVLDQDAGIHALLVRLLERNQISGNDFWIGLSYSNDEWTFNDQTTLSSFDTWADGENTGSPQRPNTCVALGESNEWDWVIQDCTTRNRFICEQLPPTPEPPTTVEATTIVCSTIPTTTPEVSTAPNTTLQSSTAASSSATSTATSQLPNTTSETTASQQPNTTASPAQTSTQQPSTTASTAATTTQQPNTTATTVAATTQRPNTTTERCTQFPCGSNGECISWVKTCNGVPDCSNGLDEFPGICMNNDPPGVCRPIPPIVQSICTHLLSYGNTSLPNYLNHTSETSTVQAAFALNQVSGCHPSFTFLMCTTVFPKCEDDQLVPPCRELCEEVQASCEAPLQAISEEWPRSCADLPSRGDGECLEPESGGCEPFPQVFQNICEPLTGYNTTSFPNSFGHLSAQQMINSREYFLFGSVLNNISSCYPDVYTAFCRMFLPQCDNGTQIQLCRSSCEEMNARCSPVGLSLPFSCNVFPDQMDDPTCFLITQATGCEPIRYSRCMGLSYSQTSFPNIVGWPNQGLALQSAPFVFPTYDPISDCHPDLNFFLCSILFPQCTSEGQILPCRSFCNEINATCGERALAAGVQWDASICPRLPDNNCSSPNDSRTTTPAGPTTPSPSTPTPTTDCVPVPYERCQNLSYSQTSFPNWLGWQGPQDAIANATAIFGALDQISDCHEDLDLFLCSLYFPSCTASGVRFPCRSFCDEINNACAARALSVGIPWDTSGCTTLPASSYGDDCIAPKATCDGWPYECFIFPGRCVGVWQFCDGSQFCPFNDDENNEFCRGLTCTPMELEFCRDEVPYNRTAFPNYFEQQNVTVVEESDIHTNVSLLADTACHEYVKFVYCHMAVPECVSDGVRGRPLCRTLCEEVRQTCSSEIEEIGFQFTKSTCDIIFPDSVQSDTCTLIKEFDCAFDVDTCDWMVGNNSQVKILQPRNDSNYGMYLSLDGVSSKLTSPTMYTDSKCLKLGYLVRGGDSKLTVYVTGPEDNTFFTWRDGGEEDGIGWSSVSLNINKGWPWFKVSLDSYVDDGGEVGVDDITLSDGLCEGQVSPGCEEIEFSRCLAMPYTYTTYPNLLGWERDLATSISPLTFGAFDQIADCHRDLNFYLCSVIFPECTPTGTRLPCRSFCENVTAACSARANAVSLAWDPNGCRSFPEAGDPQGCLAAPEPGCEPIRYSGCMGLPYSQTSFPNLVQWSSQGFALQVAPTVFPDYDNISDCHPDLNFFLCSILFPQCTSEGQILPCRSFCYEINDTCGERALALGLDWQDSICPTLPDEDCLLPDEITPPPPTEEVTATETAPPPTEEATEPPPTEEATAASPPTEEATAPSLTEEATGPPPTQEEEATAPPPTEEASAPPPAEEATAAFPPTEEATGPLPTEDASSPPLTEEVSAPPPTGEATAAFPPTEEATAPPPTEEGTALPLTEEVSAPPPTGEATAAFPPTDEATAPPPTEEASAPPLTDEVSVPPPTGEATAAFPPTEEATDPPLTEEATAPPSTEEATDATSVLPTTQVITVAPTLIRTTTAFNRPNRQQFVSDLVQVLKDSLDVVRKVLRSELVLIRPWLRAYLNHTSEEFKALRSEIKANARQAYRDLLDEFLGVTLKSLRPGSVVAELIIATSSNNLNDLAVTLQNAVSSGSFGNITVDNTSLTVEQFDFLLEGFFYLYDTPWKDTYANVSTTDYEDLHQEVHLNVLEVALHLEDASVALVKNFTEENGYVLADLLIFMPNRSVAIDKYNSLIAANRTGRFGDLNGTLWHLDDPRPFQFEPCFADMYQFSYGYNGVCYIFVNESLGADSNFEDFANACGRLGGIPAYVTDNVTHQFLVFVMQYDESLTGSIFGVGVQWNAGTALWEYWDNTDVQIRELWVDNYDPATNPPITDHCVAMTPTGTPAYAWDPEPCENFDGYVCQLAMPTTTPQPTTPAMPQFDIEPCLTESFPNGYAYNDVCYVFFNESIGGRGNINFEDFDNACDDVGGVPVYVRNTTTHDFLTYIIRNGLNSSLSGTAFGVGVQYSPAARTWEYSDDSEVTIDQLWVDSYDPATRPSTNPPRFCVVMDPSGTPSYGWNPEVCADLPGYICQLPIPPPVIDCLAGSFVVLENNDDILTDQAAYATAANNITYQLMDLMGDIDEITELDVAMLLNEDEEGDSSELD